MLNNQKCNFKREHSEFYQYSQGIKVVVSLKEQRAIEISFEGDPIDDNRLFKVGLQGYHFRNISRFFGISEEEVKKNAPCKILATNAMDVLDEDLSQRELVVCPEDRRWIILEEENGF